MSSQSKTLQHFFPWTSSPFICNAPMAFATNAELAAAVTKAGGLGLIGGGANFTLNSRDFTNLSTQLTQARQLLHEGKDPNAPIPIGISALTMQSDTWIGKFVQLVEEHKPMAVWLFAYKNRSQHQNLIQALHSTGKSWGLKIIVQVGTLQSAEEAIDDGADILSVQGSDAGGHQFEKGAGLMAFLPDVVDLVKRKFADRKVPLLAAGGIMDGKGVAAALILGANGVVMGTRFLGTTECPISPEMKARLVATQDGGSSTVKSRVHDALQGMSTFWPDQYSGRAIVSDAYRAATDGAQKGAEIAPTTETIVWAGAGVGQIRSVVSAGEIVTTAQNDAKSRIKNFVF